MVLLGSATGCSLTLTFPGGDDRPPPLSDSEQSLFLAADSAESVLGSELDAELVEVRINDDRRVEAEFRTSADARITVDEPDRVADGIEMPWYVIPDTAQPEKRRHVAACLTDGTNHHIVIRTGNGEDESTGILDIGGCPAPERFLEDWADEFAVPDEAAPTS